MRAFLFALLLTLPAATYPNGQAIGFGQDKTWVMLLHDVQYPCPTGSKRALLIHKEVPASFLGCWQVNGQTIRVVFEDGDSANVPIAELQWLPGKRPVGT